MNPTATRSDWETESLSEKRERVEVRRRYSLFDWERIQMGFLPMEMEDKWFIYAENYSVRFHRSWTGICIYTAEFEPCETGVNLVEAWVCRDPELYSETDLDEDRENLYKLIDVLIEKRSQAYLLDFAGPVKEEVFSTPKHQFEKIKYEKLNARQQESYNFQKASAILADYGFTTIRLSDDWQGADFIAQHKDGNTFLKVQLKGRLSFYTKYKGRDLYICFPCDGSWFVYPHDELLEEVLKVTTISKTESWVEGGGYSFPKISKDLLPLLQPYKIG
jgi:hypothetical protein